MITFKDQYLALSGLFFLPIQVEVLYEDRDDGGGRHSEDDADDRMHSARETDADHHAKHDGDGGESYRALHDEWNKEIVLARLDDVVDNDDDECQEEVPLRYSDEDRWDSCDDRPCVRNEFCKTGEEAQCLCVW